MPYRITGPYKYDGDTHPCFRVDSDDAVVASFYAPDGDLEAAKARADLYVHWQTYEDRHM
jgi:hypothetical protein